MSTVTRSYASVGVLDRSRFSDLTELVRMSRATQPLTSQLLVVAQQEDLLLLPAHQGNADDAEDFSRRHCRDWLAKRAGIIVQPPAKPAFDLRR